MDLTVQDVHVFVEAINSARQKAGMEVLTEIEFDESDPNNGLNCLSAHHLFDPLGAYVSSKYAESNSAESVAEIAQYLGLDEFDAWDAPTGNAKTFGVPIPETILKVTDVFDSGRDNPNALLALRRLFVKAGYVD